MSTNSRIGIIRSDGSVDSIYCHWDGNYEHNGVILYNEYQDLNKINRLIELGAISFLDADVEPRTDQNHSLSIRVMELLQHTVEIRGEKKCVINHARDISDFFKNSVSFDEEYVYLYDENESKQMTMNTYLKDILVSLEEKSKELEPVEEPVYEMGGIE